MDLRKLKDKATQAFSKGKYEKAAELYQEYCNADARDLQSRLRMGDAWVRAGDKHRGIEAYQWAAEGYARDGFLPRAIAASKLILELDPAHTETQKTLARLYAQKSGKSRPVRPPPPMHSARHAPIELPEEEPPPPPAEMAGPIELDLPPLPAAPQAPGHRLPAELELEVEVEAAPITGVELEIDVLAGQPISGEVEIPIDAAPSAPRPPPAPEVLETLEPLDPAPSPPPPLDEPMAVAPREETPKAPLVYELDAEPEEEAPATVLEVEPAEPGHDVIPLALTRRRAPEPEVVPLPGAPPGLTPKRHDDEDGAARSSRIWVPPAFEADRPAAAQGPATPSEPQSELERSLAAFTRFDPDEAPAQPAMPAVAPAALPPAHASFTELELEGDSLLHAVEAAAAHAQEDEAGPEEGEEESVESPDEVEEADRVPGGALPTIPLFSDLPEDAFIALFDGCPLRRFTTGETIIEQGSQGRSFFVVCAGKVKVYRTDQNGRHDLAALDEGAFFGEMALLSDAPRSASVEAADEDTQLLEISAEILTDLSRSHPSVAQALKKFCRQRMLTNLMATGVLFRPFTRQERRELVARFKAREVPRGVVLIKEGAETDGLYVILTGEVEVLVQGRQVATLREGELFGEMSLLTRSAATATCRATRRTSILRLPRRDFDTLIMSHPQILELVAELTDARKKKNARLLTEKTNATSDMI